MLIDRWNWEAWRGKGDTFVETISRTLRIQKSFAKYNWSERNFKNNSNIKRSNLTINRQSQRKIRITKRKNESTRKRNKRTEMHKRVFITAIKLFHRLKFKNQSLSRDNLIRS